MYKCKKCNHVFGFETETAWGQPGYDAENGDGWIDSCPLCGSGNFIEVAECECCGKYISVTDNLGLCEGCEAKVRKSMGKSLAKFVEDFEDYEVSILEEMLNELELTSLLYKIKEDRMSEEK